jgi:hypothetical protein
LLKENIKKKCTFKKEKKQKWGRWDSNPSPWQFNSARPPLGRESLGDTSLLPSQNKQNNNFKPKMRAPWHHLPPQNQTHFSNFSNTHLPL